MVGNFRPVFSIVITIGICHRENVDNLLLADNSSGINHKYSLLANF